MSDQDKTREQLIAELVELRRRVADQSALPELRTAAALLQVAPLGIHECDLEGRITFVNPSHEAITGFTAEELVGSYIWDRMAPGPEKDSVPAQFKQVLAEQPAPTPYFAKNIKKNGDLFDVRVDWNYIRNPQGEVLGFLSIVTDVTEERKAQAALRESEERYRTLGEATTDVIYILDQAGKLLYANRTAAAYFGVSSGALVGKSQHDLFPPEQVPFHLEHIRKVFETGEMQEVESLYRFGPHEVWLNVRTIPLRDEQGRITSAMGVCRNITEQKRAELALRESEQRFRKVFEEGPLGVVLARRDGRIQHVNRRFCDLLGYSETEIIELGIARFSHSDDHHLDEQLAARLLRGEIPSYTIDKRLLRKDGQVIWGRLTVSLLRDAEGQPTHAIGMIEDIRDRRQAEEAVRQSEQRMRLHVQQTPLAVIEWDLELRVSKWNPRAERIFGYTEEEALGRHFPFLVPPDVRGHTERLWTALLVKKGGEHSTNANVTKDGRTILCEWYNTPLVNTEGEVVGFASLAEDITERSQAEAALRQAHDELEQKVKERTAELTKANELLKAEVEQRRQAEQALRDSEERLTFALEASGIGAWDLDLLDHTAHRSLQYARIFGYQSLSPSWTFERFLEHVLPEDREAVNQQLRQTLDAQGDYRFECRIRRSDGEIRWIWVAGRQRPEESGRPRRRAGIVQDITDRKKAEEAIRQSEAKYRALVESSPDAVGMLDLQGRLVFASQRAAEQYGVLHPDELVGRQAMDFLVTADHDKFRASFQRLIEEGVQRDIQYTLFRTDGTTFDAEISSAVIRDARGNPEAVTCVFRDITQRKLAEEKVKAEQQALRRMVMASDHERRLITYELHDGAAQKLMGAMMLFQSPALQKAWRSADTQAIYRLGMDGLRGASAELRRVMSWLRTPVLDMYGLAEAIADVASQLRLTPGAPEIEYRHAVTFKRLEPTLENTLFRIAQEAMTNACRYSKSEKVQVKLTQKGDDVTLEVRDGGIGFDQGTVKENRFGLEGIRERSRILGGKLSIKSKPGEGTVVRVKFPVIEATGEE